MSSWCRVPGYSGSTAAVRRHGQHLQDAGRRRFFRFTQLVTRHFEFRRQQRRREEVQQRLMYPLLPALGPPLAATVDAAGWSTINDVDIMKFIVSPVPTFGHKGNDLTKGQCRRLAHAVVDVLERANDDALSDAERAQAQLWLLALPRLLLHIPNGMKDVIEDDDSAVRTARAALLDTRFALWSDGHAGKLKLLRAFITTSDSHVDDPAQKDDNGWKLVPEVVRLIASARMSKAMRLLSSDGLADMTSDEVIAELQDKHLDREQDIPSLASLLNGRVPGR